MPSNIRSWFTSLQLRGPDSAQPPCLPSAQIHSQLLRSLPLEVRRQIYTEVLLAFGSVQHIILWEFKLTHMRCASPASHAYFQTWTTRNGICNMYEPYCRKSMENGWGILSLLLSCHQIHGEFAEIIYSSAIFRMPINAATRFIAVVPARYIALTHLHLIFEATSPMYLPPRAWPIGFTVANTNPSAAEVKWEAFWRALARLRICDLVVEILDHAVRMPEQALLGPLREVRAGSFEVVLPWPEGLETSGEFGDAGFVVRRPPESVGRGLMLDLDVAYYNTGLEPTRVKRLRRWFRRL